MPDPSDLPDRPAPRWSLPDNPDLGWLRKQAKRLRRRYAAGDTEAVDLVSVYDPPAPSSLPLARAQRVLARAFGFANWPRLREHLAVIERYARSPQAAAGDGGGDGGGDEFLRLATLSYRHNDHEGLARATALAATGDLPADVWTLAATGRTAALERLLAEQPQLANADGGPHRWSPLLYLTYARLGEHRGDPVGSARVLLSAGADPNTGFLWDGLTSPFTALTGAFGGGERDESPHPDATALARVLLEAGADPNDNQTLYNRMFRPDDSHLEVLLGHGLGDPHPSPWRDRLGDSYPSPVEMVGEHLRSAAESGFGHRVELLLAHGVDPNTVGYHPILGDQNAYEVAVRTGHPEIAALLAAAGGRSGRLDAVDLLLADLLSGTPVDADPALVRAAVERRPDAMARAVDHGQDSALPLLLAAGFDVNGSGRDRRTALHEAALAGRDDLVTWLLDHGADPTRHDGEHGGTPAGWAAYAGHRDLSARLEAAAGPGA
jgi:ankyrin repeat protein